MNGRFKFAFVSLSASLVVLLLVGALVGKSAPSDVPAYRQMQVYMEVLAKIKSDYVEEPDLKSVTLGAMNGLLESIDPFASYLNAEQYKQYMKNRGTKKADVGLILSKRYGYVGVVSALPDSPAAKVGLTTGDLIESINSVATRDMPLAYAELLLQGAPGTKVEISILRMRNPEPQKITLTRETVPVPPVISKMLADQVGYVRPETLLAGKTAEIVAAIKSLEQQGAQRLVLDLRQCAIGTPEEGLALANLFLNKGLMAYLEGQRVPRQNFDAKPEKYLFRLPLVVATNRGTADGAELAASALLENKRAEVVGERSFGDAAVRRAISMEDGSAIILSVAKYFTPQGKALQDTGVIPSVPFVESEPFTEIEDEEGVETPEVAPQPKKPEEDSLLKKAIEVLLQSKPQTASVHAPLSGQAVPKEISFAYATV